MTVNSNAICPTLWLGFCDSARSARFMASRSNMPALNIRTPNPRPALTIEEWKAKTPLGDVEGCLSVESRLLSESVHPHFTL